MTPPPASVAAPEPAAPEAPFAFPRWVTAVALAALSLGLAGLSGSSSWAESVRDLLLEPEVRATHPEILGRSRLIRGDEFVVELPAERSQQLAGPPFPLVNLEQGLGQIERNAALVPVLDWGLIFRPLGWPMLVRTRWGLGARWYLRTFVLVLGLFAWFRVLSPRRRGAEGGAAARRDDVIAALCAAAILFSSGFSWWMSTSFTETIGFAGLAIAAVDRRRTAATPWRRGLWSLVALWLLACTFFPFYAPLWGPTLWLVCGAVFDLHWRATRSLRAALRASWPVILLVAAAVVLAIVYYAPYLAAVAGTVYPGRRAIAPGDVPFGRLLHLSWPSLLAFTPPRGDEIYLGWPGWNVCEASVIEVLPLFVIAALATLDGAVRSAVRRALAGSPGVTVAAAVLLAWMTLKLPPGLATALLLRWTPTGRALFTFGVALALLTGAVLLQLGSEPSPRTSTRDALVAAGVLLVTYLAARSSVFVRLTGTNAVLHDLPMYLFAVLLVAGMAAARSRSGAVLVAASWAVPLVLANLFVNPVVRSRDLLREGAGHAVVSRALERSPGRVLHYWTHDGSYLNGFGWPMLAGVEHAPDVDLFRYLSPDAPGLTEEAFNRYAHVLAVLPPEPSRLLQGDAFAIALSPCSDRLATLGVNHLLVRSTARLPDRCANEFRVTPAGDLLLWSRVDAVREIGVARSARPASALDFDFRRAGAPTSARVERSRTGLDVTVPSASAAIAFPVNLSAIGEVRCAGARARALDAHLVFEPNGPGPGRCRVEYLGSAEALRRLGGRTAGPSFREQPAR